MTRAPVDAGTGNALLRTEGDVEPAWPAAFQQWQENMFVRLRAGLPTPGPCLRDAGLLEQLNGLDDQLQALPATLQRHWDTQRPSRALARRFAGQCVLLVFGRFNAGKSSFCNHLAQRAATAGASVKYFRVEGERIAWDGGAFAEGETETTVGIQGVSVGGSWVLVDTPGLHSVTAANARTTRAFLDCADGMLWLSSSSAPGQVQELEDLGQELRRGKPVQPVLTRSDQRDEDECDGRIVSVLCNKPAEVRLLQEQDVVSRARSKLLQMGVDADVLQAPVSVSIHAARLPGVPEAIEAAAGLLALDQALQRLETGSRAYRARKPQEVVLHHLQEHVLGQVELTFLSAVSALQGVLLSKKRNLDERLRAVHRAVWKNTLLQVPALLDGTLGHGSLERIREALDVLAGAELRRQLALVLPEFALTPSPCLLVEGALSAAMPNGDALGLPGNATVYERLYPALESALATALEAALQDARDQASTALDCLYAPLQGLHGAVVAARQALQGLAAELRQQDVATS